MTGINDQRFARNIYTSRKVITFYFRPKKSITIITLSFAIVFIILYALSDTIDEPEYENQACHMPKLDINNAEVLQYLHYQPPLKCSDEVDWVKVEGSVAEITKEAKKKYGPIECQFTDIHRSSDFATFEGNTVLTHTEFDLEESDFFRVYCQAESRERWQNRMAGVRSDANVRDRAGWWKTPNDGLKLNVLMFGFDSLSRMTFMRKLPKSYQKLQALNAIVLEGYNILGDGTPQAILPLLTGKTEKELPDARKRMGSKAVYVDNFPFIWNDYKNSGYVTAFMEDIPETGIFTFRLKGFQNQPTDHYMRTWYVDSEDYFKNNQPYCMGSIPRHKVMLDYIKQLYNVYRYKPKFIFGFHGELSHDSYNLIGAADDDVADWIDWLEKEGHLNNTVLIMMSDHGHRFAGIRSTQQGKLEERLPFFSFTFPPWFKNEYPEAINNFKENAQRLTTAFDINKTLWNLLHFEGVGDGLLSDRAISLFKKIPQERSCYHAHIEPHWCACLQWRKISQQEPVVRNAATAFVRYINEYMSAATNKCIPLELLNILDAARLAPNRRVMMFKSSLDADGLVPDFSDRIKTTTEVYQIRVLVSPSGALFEFSVLYDKLHDKYMFQIDDVSRINKYGDDADCIINDQEQLRKYCYCRK